MSTRILTVLLLVSNYVGISLTTPVTQEDAKSLVALHQQSALQTILVTVTETSTATLTQTRTTTSEAIKSEETFAYGYVSVQDDPRIPEKVANEIPYPPNAEAILFLPPAPVSFPSTIVANSTLPLLSDIPDFGTDNSTGNGNDTGSDHVYSGDSNSSTTWASRSPPLKGPLVAGYYPDWATGALAPEDINFSLLDWIDFAFAIPDSHAGITWDDPSSSPGILKRLVAAAHAHNTNVKVSIGGWSGSRHFSTSVASEKSRKTFASNIKKLYNEFNLDGVDIDWEFPGQQGEGKNKVSPDDTANFLVFLKLLRETLPHKARITAAVQTVPFADSNGKPSRNVAGFAEVLDYVLLMNYDTWGSSSDPGPNAPLDNGCHNSTQPHANAKAAVRTWTKAGFPASKLVLGVPAYGYINPSSAMHLHTRDTRRSFQIGNTIVLPRMDTAAQVVVLKNSEGNTDGGQIQFNELLQQGAIIRARPDQGGDGEGPHPLPEFVGDGGFTRFWDDCSSTPFLTSPYANQVITYDDPVSLSLKAEYAKSMGLLGVCMFDITGDTRQWDLLGSLRGSLGLSPH